jgi:hypothetical protein
LNQRLAFVDFGKDLLIMNQLRIFKRTAKFVVVMFAMTIVCTGVWQCFVTDKLYNCTDPGWLDFLSPGDWVHVHDGKPVALVPVITGGSMSDPDTIREGWSVARLWYLWYSLVAISVVIGVLLTLIRWIPKQTNRNANVN